MFVALIQRGYSSLVLTVYLAGIPQHRSRRGSGGEGRGGEGQNWDGGMISCRSRHDMMLMDRL